VIRVLVVDDHPFVRAALASLLATFDDIAVVGECGDGAEVLSAAAALDPQVVLMDVEMPILSGLDATRQLVAARPEVAVLMVTGSSVTVTPRDAKAAGAVGYLPKGGRPEPLAAAIRSAAAGGTAWPTDRGGKSE
jgi:DNA-binding NarL/FixJ family response regulator